MYFLKMNSQLFAAARSLIQDGRRSAAINLLGRHRQFGMSIRSMSSMNEKFGEAQAQLKGISDQSNDVKLKLYGLFKQSTVGKNTTKKPAMLDMVGKAKWQAWASVGDISQEEDQKQYVELVEKLVAENGAKNSPKTSEGPGMTTDVRDGIRLITLNRPDKRNAIATEMYTTLTETLTEANTDDSTKIVVLTGTGDYFCSGNDIGNFAKVTDVKAMAETVKTTLQTYVAAYIDCKKPLIVLVNGPAVGIGVTILGMADIVYATERATFTTPFTSLGQTPEACSSYMFPRIMGYAKASEMLLFNSKISARQALDSGLLTEIFPDDSFESETNKRIQEFAKLPVKSLVYSKELVRGPERQKLHEVNEAECTRMCERWQSEDSMNALMKFLSRKK